MIEFAFQKNPSESNMESCLDSELQASNGTKFGVDLRKVQKAVIIAQIRNKGLIWKIGVGLENKIWITEVSSMGCF